MKNLILSMFLLVISFVVSSQVPSGLNYQAVVRNASGDIISNTSVTLRISILEKSESGSVVYSETHNTATNKFGLVNLVIGQGNTVSGIFTPGGWGLNKHFVKVEMDTEGGDNFVHLGTTQLLSVPYAFHAQTVEEDKIEDDDSDPVNEIQELHLSGTILSLSNSSKTVTLPSSGEGGDNWGTQTVLTDETLNGDGTSLNPLSVFQDNITMDWTKIKNIPAEFDDNIDNVDDLDNDTTNEIQTISISGSELSISKGNTITLPLGEGGDNWGTQVVQTDITLKGDGSSSDPLGVQQGNIMPDWTNINNIPAGFGDNIDDVDDLDNNSSNEIQTLSLSGADLTISDGNTVTLPLGEGGDNWGTQTVVSNSTLTGNGTASSPLEVVGSLTDNQTLSLTGNDLSISGGNSVTLPVPGSSLWQQNASNIYYNEGNVGIGTISPGTKLEVKSNGGPNIIINDSNGSSDRPGIQFLNNSQHFISGDDLSNEYFGFYSIFNHTRSNDAKLSVYGKSTSSWGTYIGLTHDGSKGIINTDVGDIIILPGSGNLGIGTDAPQSGISLHAGTKASEIRFTNNSTGQLSSDGLRVGILPSLKSAYVWNYEDAELYFGTNNNRYMTIESNGRIGIGTNSPDGALDIESNSTATFPNLLLTEDDADYARLMFKNSAAASKNWVMAGTLASADPSSKLIFSYFNGSSSKSLITVTGDGEVQQNRTGNANMIPIAYGAVHSTGSKVMGTSNFSSSYDATNKRYFITISGESYSDDYHISFITINTFAFTSSCGSLGGKLVVYLKNKDGDLQQGGFSFITYKP